MKESSTTTNQKKRNQLSHEAYKCTCLFQIFFFFGCLCRCMSVLCVRERWRLIHLLVKTLALSHTNTCTKKHFGKEQPYGRMLHYKIDQQRDTTQKHWLHLRSTVSQSCNCQKKTADHNKSRIITCPLILSF